MEGSRLDPVTFEVLRNAFVQVCNEMALAVELSAYSLIISEGRDFSATLYDGEGRLVGQGANDLPSHAGTTPFTVRSTIERVGVERMRPGDVYVMNDPYLGGTHLQDVRLVMPIFHGERIVATRRASQVIRNAAVARVITLEPGQFWGADIFCLPEYRNQNIGRHLKIFGDRYMASLGYKEFLSSIEVSNVPSIRSARAAGRRAVYYVSYVKILFWERLRASRDVPSRFWDDTT